MVKGLLLDLDGVLHTGDQPLPGAQTTLAWLQAQDIPHLFVTNTSTQSLAGLSQRLQAMGLAIAPEQIFCAPQAAAHWLRQQGLTRIWPLVSPQVQGDLADFTLDEQTPEALLIGDIGPVWDYALLNRAFACLQQGARLVAIHKNRSWQTPQGLMLDIGAFVAALEYAVPCEAVVIGKPNPDFFAAALARLQLPAGEVAMVGDDIFSDIDGAQQSGLTGILVRTGKYRPQTLADSGIRPDVSLPDIGALPAWWAGKAG
ncbi:TIGR01458 family HAD-type hydrolase [Pseudaeromonas sp. ZJS20]|uniref:TIGR01458 family HAD-type hydrolase n=1 Tax=Pseudaeromonas aegiceratis TaxID=3153928 RepID=UPI00390CACE3